jgi:hypothetical protein
MKWLRYKIGGEIRYGVLDQAEIRQSKYITMYPGDVLWMGAEAPTLDMRHGDVVEVEIGNIGVLRNPVVTEGRLT